MNSKSQDFH
ncbi:hypothetical protein MC885_010657 [Smutsia gigantea]|nr:hypothetical protein MC885_010657 [Smutsia gigantea]